MAYTFFDRLFKTLILAIVFLLPWHTAYIFSFDPNASQYTRISFTLLDGLSICAFIVFVFSILARSRQSAIFGKAIIDPRASSPFPGYVLATLALFIGTAFLSLLFTTHTGFAFFSLVRLLEGGALFLIVFSGILDKKIIAAVFVAAGALQAILGMQQIFVQEIFAHPWLGISSHTGAILGDSVVEGEGFRFLRAYGSFPHPNMLAAFLGVSFFAGWYLLVASMTRKARIASFIGSMIILLGLLFTFSRGAWLAFGLSSAFIAIAYFVGKRREEQKLFSVSAVLIIAIFTIAYWQPVSVRLGVAYPARLETRSFEDRVSSVQEAITLFGIYPFGVGIGQYIPHFIDRDAALGKSRPVYAYQPAHSHVVMVLAELGAQGCIAFLAFITAVIVSMLGKPGFRIYAVIPFFLVVAGLFDHYFWTFQSGALLWWIALGLGGADCPKTVEAHRLSFPSPRRRGTRESSRNKCYSLGLDPGSSPG